MSNENLIIGISDELRHNRHLHVKSLYIYVKEFVFKFEKECWMAAAAAKKELISA